MFKQLAITLGAFLMCGSGYAVSMADNVTSTAILTPTLQDLTTYDFVISKIILNSDYTAIETTVTLDMHQDAKGKIVGTAKFNSTRDDQGKPSIAIPVDIPIVGKIKGTGFSIKGTKKYAGGADFHSRSITLTASGQMDLNTFIPAGFTSNDDKKSTVTYDTSLKLTGLSYNYNYSARVVHTGENNFHYQPSRDTAGLKQPKVGEYVDISVPWGFTRGTGVVTVVGNDTVLSIKANGLKATVVEANGAGLYPMYPTYFELKSKGGSVMIDNPFFRIVSFIIIVLT